MSYKATVYRIFIASPNDTKEECKAVTEAVYSWNDTNSFRHKVILEPVKWETHAKPEISEEGGQEIINKQLVRACDILIGIFKTRLGTPTEKAESGTLEEIGEFQNARKPIMLYFWSASPEIKETDQYKKLLKFKAQIKGLKFDYKSIEELRDRVKNHITQTVYDIRKVSTFRRLMEYLKNFLQSSVRALKGLSIKRVAPKESIKPRVYDEKKHPPIGSAQLPSYKWDARNFEGFWYIPEAESTSEILEIGGSLGNLLTTTMDHNNRTLPEKTLVYLTVKQARTLKIVENGIIPVDLLNSFPNGQYHTLGWQAQPYIAIKAKANKLSKIILEQGNDDTKNLTVGETWDMGDGYELTPQAIDSRAIPRQVWFVLSKNGIKLNDKVIAQGEAYIYTPNIAGETFVPIFVTYVDSVFAGKMSDMVQLKYTWLISSTVTEIMAGDKFGIMEVVTSDHEYLILKNYQPIKLLKGSTVDIMGNLKFKVADDPNFLRFHPIVTP